MRLTHVGIASVLCAVSAAAVLAASGPLAAAPAGGNVPAIAAVAPSIAQEAMSWRVREADSNVTFAVTKLGAFRVEGRFRKVSGAVLLDRGHPERSRVRVVVETESVDTGVSGRDRAVRSSGLLDVARFPLMTFVSTQVEPDPHDADAVRVTGDLTIHGVSRRITAPARLLAASRTDEGEVAGFECRFEIDRRDFGVGLHGFAPSFVGHEVSVRVLLGAQRDLR